ncbi:hypothetical protein EDC04DRAFT_2604849 [Pisolithus marmoratus]|nr:hypothetical protein EDC04DRAFT_2604849 [Pisolithus marmoratus]
MSGNMTTTLLPNSTIFFAHLLLECWGGWSTGEYWSGWGGWNLESEGLGCWGCWGKLGRMDSLELNQWFADDLKTWTQTLMSTEHATPNASNHLARRSWPHLMVLGHLPVWSSGILHVSGHHAHRRVIRDWNGMEIFQNRILKWVMNGMQMAKEHFSAVQPTMHKLHCNLWIAQQFHEELFETILEPLLRNHDGTGSNEGENVNIYINFDDTMTTAVNTSTTDPVVPWPSSPGCLTWKAKNVAYGTCHFFKKEEYTTCHENHTRGNQDEEMIEVDEDNEDEDLDDQSVLSIPCASPY